MLRGFDAQFSSIEDYILKITASIWEGGQMGDIERYYSRECVVESPLSVSRGIQPVIDGTAATLQSFPDRRLLAEAVLVSGSDEIGFLSSHRILSPMVHAGSGRFGVPTNKPIFVRTIADCVCRDNQIQHEWLVRDHGAIARQIGVLPSVLAQDWMRLDQNWQPPPPTTAPTPFRPIIDESRLCKTYIQSLHDTYGSLRSRFEVRPIGLSAEGVIAWHPGGFTSVGRHQRMGRIASLLDGLSFHSLDVEHCARHPHIRPGIESISCRFRARFVHNQYGHFGEPTGSIVSVLVIQHSELQDGMVFREWTLLDEVSIWMQVLSGRRGPK